MKVYRPSLSSRVDQGRQRRAMLAAIFGVPTPRPAFQGERATLSGGFTTLIFNKLLSHSSSPQATEYQNSPMLSASSGESGVASTSSLRKAVQWAVSASHNSTDILMMSRCSFGIARNATRNPGNSGVMSMSDSRNASICLHRI